MVNFSTFLLHVNKISGQSEISGATAPPYSKIDENVKRCLHQYQNETK